MTTADTTAEAGTKKRLNLAPLQKFGRSLMLPIAALPVAAIMLRLGQPDLLGADGLGRRVDRAGCRRRLSGLQGRRGCRVPVRAPAAPAG